MSTIEVSNISNEVTQNLIPAPAHFVGKDKCKEATTGRWTVEEHQLFLEGLKIHKKQWKLIAELIKTRTVVQVRTHAQKYFQKLLKSAKLEDFESGSIPDFIALAAKKSDDKFSDDDVDGETLSSTAFSKGDKRVKSPRPRSDSVDFSNQRSKKQRIDSIAEVIFSEPSNANRQFFNDFESEIGLLDPNTWHNGFDFVDWFVSSENNVRQNIVGTISSEIFTEQEKRCRENSIATSVESLDQDAEDFKLESLQNNQSHNFYHISKPILCIDTDFNGETTSDGELSSSSSSSSSSGEYLESSSWDDDDMFVNDLLEVLA